MEVTMRFTLPEEREELAMAQNGPAYRAALDMVADNVFRPARKHGYPQDRHGIAELVQKIGPDANDLIWALERLFYEILEDCGAKL